MNERELLRVLRKIVNGLRAIQQDIHAIYEKANAYGDQEHPPTQVDIQSQIRLPPAVNDYYESENAEGPKDRRRDRARLWLEGITLGAAVLAAILAYNAYLQTRRQAKAAETQAGIMQQQFEFTDRPWIEITRAVPNQNAVFRDGNLNVGLTLFVKNVGKSVAIQIAEKAKAITAKDGDEYFVSSLREQKTKCSEKNATGLPLTLFPDQSSENAWWESMQAGFSVNVADGKFMAPDRKTELIHPLIVGCIDYQIATGKPHQTYFIYDLGVFRVGRDVPLPNLKVEAFHFGGFDVN
jgi:archaellum component FlaG (FlaF/FlaG flagellin family)